MNGERSASLIDASRRFAQRMTGNGLSISSEVDYDRQKQIAQETTRKVIEDFYPKDAVEVDYPRIVLFNQVDHEVEDIFILDEVVMCDEEGCILNITEDLVRTVAKLYGPYMSNYANRHEMNLDEESKYRSEKSIEIATRMAAAQWLFERLDPRNQWGYLEDQSIVDAVIHAGLGKDDTDESDSSMLLDKSKYSFIGAVVATGFDDDPGYFSFHGIATAFINQQMLDKSYEARHDPALGIKYSLISACSAENARGMLTELNRFNQLIAKYTYH